MRAGTRGHAFAGGARRRNWLAKRHNTLSLGKGGRDAFEELLSRELDALYGMALRLCRGRSTDAEDLLQETALRAFRHFNELRELGAGRTWLFRILLRTHLNRTRAADRRKETLESDLDEATFEQALAAWQGVETRVGIEGDYLLREQVTAAVDALPGPMRDVLWLVDVEGFRQREAAELLDVPEGTVASRLYRARRTLRDALAALIESSSGKDQKEPS